MIGTKIAEFTGGFTRGGGRRGVGGITPYLTSKEGGIEKWRPQRLVKKNLGESIRIMMACLADDVLFHAYFQKSPAL
jgi:hypothetical protein